MKKKNIITPLRHPRLSLDYGVEKRESREPNEAREREALQSSASGHGAHFSGRSEFEAGSTTILGYDAMLR